MTVVARLHAALATLGLTEADAVVEAHLERAATDERAYAEVLCELLDREVEARRARYLRTRMRLAHLPFIKTLDQFDFGFQPSIDERQIRELRTLRFVHDASNVIFLGPPGVGKTHLAVALAVEAIRAGFSAYFITAHDLTADLGRASREGRLDRRLRVYLAPRVLVIDEMGYLPLDDLGATIFFQLVSARYERGSIVLTSNKSYGDWGAIFGGPIIVTAILDRLLHHSTTVNIRGDSYRLKARKKAGLLPAVQGQPQGSQTARAADRGGAAHRGFQESCPEPDEVPSLPGGGEDGDTGYEGGEFSIGDLGRFKSALTHGPGGSGPTMYPGAPPGFSVTISPLGGEARSAQEHPPGALQV
jgi:DNA replication protein DnaC